MSKSREFPPALLGSDDDEMVLVVSKDSTTNLGTLKGCLALPLLLIPAAVALLEVAGEVVIDLKQWMVRYASRKPQGRVDS